MTAPAETLIHIENLRVQIPTSTGMLHAVRGIDISVKRGETLCIVGESGCGKSLSALAILNLLPKMARRSADTIKLFDTELTQLSEREMSHLRGNEIAMVFQEPMTSLNPTFTIGNQLEEAYLLHHKARRDEARARAVNLLDKVGIPAAETRLSQYPHQLSGGLRQRVMIAMALMCDPSVIIADEPTTALDVTIQAQILKLILDLQAEFQMGLILITHDLGVVARIADRVAVMYAGQIVETAGVEALFDNPRHPYTRGLMNCIPVPTKDHGKHRLGSIPGVVPTLIGESTGCSFATRCEFATDECRAENVPLTPAEGGRAYRCIHPVGQATETANQGQTV